MALGAALPFSPHRLSWPIGFGFRPTEEELITHYLINKILGNECVVKYIHEIDLYNYDPWQLPAKSFLESDNYEWFFFRAHTSKTKRSTPAGCWKTTGDDRPIKARGTNKPIATRKILVFYRGRGANAVKTNWVIHEYHLHPDAYNSLYHYQPPFVICRLKENAEERHVSICDQDEHNTTLAASHLKNKGKAKMNRDAQASEQPPALHDFQSVNPLSMQPIQPGASGNEVNLTEILNSILLPDECLDDATSKMCGPSFSSLSEPAFMDFQSSIGNDGEVNIQSLPAQVFKSGHNLYEHLLHSMLSDDENCGDDRINCYNKEELDSMVFELQHGGFSSDIDTDTTLVLPNDHTSSSCFHEYRTSAMQNSSTVKRLHRRPLAAKRFQYEEKQYVLQEGSSVLASEGEAQAALSHESESKRGMSCRGSIGSTDNRFSYILTTKCIRHNSSLPLVYAAKAFLGILLFVGFAQEMLQYGHRR